MEHGREENFTWAPEKLKVLFTSENFLPNVLVTDCELALMNVMKVVFSNSTHLLCMFHISKNISMKWKEYVESHRHGHDMDMWNNFIYSNRGTDFLVHLKHFEVICDDIPKVVEVVLSN